jgi:hypothetical protein
MNGSLAHTYNSAHSAVALSNCYVGVDSAIVGSRTWPGLLDNIGFFSTTLTASEVSNLYERSLFA